MYSTQDWQRAYIQPRWLSVKNSQSGGRPHHTPSAARSNAPSPITTVVSDGRYMKVTHSNCCMSWPYTNTMALGFMQSTQLQLQRQQLGSSSSSSSSPHLLCAPSAGTEDAPLLRNCCSNPCSCLNAVHLGAGFDHHHFHRPFNASCSARLMTVHTDTTCSVVNRQPT